MLPVGVLCVVAFLAVLFTKRINKWNNPNCKSGILPPGSMGLPFIGETLEFLIPGHSLDVHPFIKKRIQRYGPIFRTSLAGYRMVVSADPEVNHYISLQEGKSVELWYFNNFTKIFDTDGALNSEAFTATHLYVKTKIMKNFGAESLKEKLLPQIEKLVHETLNSWSKQESINAQQALGKMVCNFLAKQMFSYDVAKDPEDLSETFVNFMQSLLSFPVNIPGTAFYDSLKKKDFLINIIREKLRERLGSPDAYQGDILDQLIEDMKTESFITEDFVIHFVFAFLFASYESLAMTLTLAFKLLSDHPLIVDELRAEHELILNKRKPGVPLTWSDYKSMTFTLQVINEVLRLENSMPGKPRKATKDIHVNGYTIPQGWAIIIASSAQHLNPNTYDDPLAFNPHRWKELDPSVISKNFMPFGIGTRQCAGAKYSRVLMSIFFHVLCTNYRWTKLKGGEKIGRKPFLDFGDGIYIIVSEDFYTETHAETLTVGVGPAQWDPLLQLPKSNRTSNFVIA